MLVFRFPFLRFPRSVLPDLSCFPSRFRYLAFCLFPFALPRFASHSCSTSAPLVLSLSGFSASLPVPFVPFCSASGYLAFCVFLSASSRFRLTVAYPVLRLRSRFLGFPRSSLPGFPCALSRFPYSAFCSFPFVLPGFAPTAVPPVLPFFSAFFRPLLFRAFRLLSGFFRSLQPASDYSAFCAFFSPLPDFPWQRFFRCATVSFVPVAFLFRWACFHAFLPIPVLSFLRFLSPFTVSCHRHYAVPGLLFPARPFPFAFALGSGYSACRFGFLFPAAT